MQVDWEDMLVRLRMYPGSVNRILPPCESARVTAVENQLGGLPDTLRDMLTQFNGAELFIDGMPFVTIFGISPVLPVSALEWAPDWYIDKMTPMWRAIRGQDELFAFAMMNYGGLLLVDANCIVKEWDTAQRKWSVQTWTMAEWIETVLRDGEATLKEQ